MEKQATSEVARQNEHALGTSTDGISSYSTNGGSKAFKQSGKEMALCRSDLQEESPLSTHTPSPCSASAVSMNLASSNHKTCPKPDFCGAVSNARPEVCRDSGSVANLPSRVSPSAEVGSVEAISSAQVSTSGPSRIRRLFCSRVLTSSANSTDLGNAASCDGQRQPAACEASSSSASGSPKSDCSEANLSLHPMSSPQLTNGSCTGPLIRGQTGGNTSPVPNRHSRVTQSLSLIQVTPTGRIRSTTLAFPEHQKNKVSDETNSPKSNASKSKGKMSSWALKLCKRGTASLASHSSAHSSAEDSTTGCLAMSAMPVSGTEPLKMVHCNKLRGQAPLSDSNEGSQRMENNTYDEQPCCSISIPSPMLAATARSSDLKVQSMSPNVICAGTPRSAASNPSRPIGQVTNGDMNLPNTHTFGNSINDLQTRTSEKTTFTSLSGSSNACFVNSLSHIISNNSVNGITGHGVDTSCSSDDVNKHFAQLLLPSTSSSIRCSPPLVPPNCPTSSVLSVNQIPTWSSYKSKTLTVSTKQQPLYANVPNPATNCDSLFVDEQTFGNHCSSPQPPGDHCGVIAPTQATIPATASLTSEPTRLNNTTCNANYQSSCYVHDNGNCKERHRTDAAGNSCCYGDSRLRSVSPFSNKISAEDLINSIAPSVAPGVESKNLRRCHCGTSRQVYRICDNSCNYNSEGCSSLCATYTRALSGDGNSENPSLTSVVTTASTPNATRRRMATAKINHHLRCSDTAARSSVSSKEIELSSSSAIFQCITSLASGSASQDTVTPSIPPTSSQQQCGIHLPAISQNSDRMTVTSASLDELEVPLEFQKNRCYSVQLYPSLTAISQDLGREDRSQQVPTLAGPNDLDLPVPIQDHRGLALYRETDPAISIGIDGSSYELYEPVADGVISTLPLSDILTWQNGSHRRVPYVPGWEYAGSAVSSHTTEHFRDISNSSDHVLDTTSRVKSTAANLREVSHAFGIFENPLVSLLSAELPSCSNNRASSAVHTTVDYMHCLVPDLAAIFRCGFYWGKMDRYEAEKLLEKKPEGSFLLRDSAHEEYLFSVSFRRYSGSLHARIEQWNHKFSFDSHDPAVFSSPTVCGLIEHYKDPANCMYFEPMLTIPINRQFPFSLQQLARCAITERVNYDQISFLRLPKPLKAYLREYHYKQRVRVRYIQRE